MPLVKFDVVEGRTESELRMLLDTAHQAVIESFQVPESDRYQVVHSHKPCEMILSDTGLGLERTDASVVMTVISKSRPEKMKVELYRSLASRLEACCGIKSSDLIVSVIENTGPDWSFGLGEAQFVTGKL
ncbi:tautomerase family protein [Chromohalobacter sp. 11-W]|uniref:tautomerase family protein n=1 Tax=Chromohalobacter sp. 11-W TaxID=2994061 RepID=UPI0024687121|nr:tautomerase family protein [Chromohalobacter sp. 11-W]